MSSEPEVVIIAEKSKDIDVVFDAEEMSAHVQGWTYYFVFIRASLLDKNKGLITCGNVMPFAKKVGRYNLRRDNCGMHALIAHFEREKCSEELCSGLKVCDRADMSTSIERKKYYLAMQVKHSLLSNSKYVKSGDIIPIFAV